MKIVWDGLFGRSTYESSYEPTPPVTWPWPNPSVEVMEKERNRYIRLFNRLEAAVSHHKKAHTPEGRYFADDPDVALWKARDKILHDACEGNG